MSWAILARVLTATAMLPLGGLLTRLVLGVLTAAWLSLHLPAPPTFSVIALLSELALGACLGLLAGLPAHAGEALRGDGPASLGALGRALSWAVFFGVGGPWWWLAGLGHGFEVLPAAAWPDVTALIDGGGGLLYAAFALGLPAWLATLATAPLAGWVERLDGPGLSSFNATRPLVFVLLWAGLLPFAVETLSALWRAGIPGG